MRPTKILHPTDYSDISEAALCTAGELAREHGALLVILHVVETLGPEKLTFGEESQPQPEAYRQRLWEEIHQVRPPDSQTRVEYVLSEEDPVTAILRTVEKQGCDLIVLGTHGITGWRRWFLPSVAEEVVRRATCPVLVVKSPREPEPLRPIQGTDLHPGYLFEKKESSSPASGA
jgi:nucleotide-binding universal stress UspA family protein